MLFPEEGETGEDADIPYAVPDIPEASTADQAEEAMKSEICPRPTCHLTLKQLARYAFSAGDVVLIDEITRSVPSNCSWHDIHRGGPPPDLLF